MMGRGMPAVQEAIGQQERALRRLGRWPSCWPLPAMPTSLIVYVLAVLACDLVLIGWGLAVTPPRAADLLLFGALLAAAVICIEAMRRLGQPSGVSRDLLSAWWLPIALLLPPLYALLAPFAVGAVLAARARRIPVYRRVFGSAALGLAGAATSAAFHLAVPDAVLAGPGAERAWLTRPPVVLTAVACAVVFALVNSFTVAVAAHLADPGEPIRKMLGDRETLLLGLTETCAGILVAVTCALSYLLLLVALPPVILLQRSLMHQQLAAAARTDPKTGLLNATAWQREADAEVARAGARTHHWPCCWSTSIISSGSTTATVTWSATRCCGRWPPSSGSRSGSRTRWAGSAARSSRSCCPAPTTPAPTGSQNGCAPARPT